MLTQQSTQRATENNLILWFKLHAFRHIKYYIFYNRLTVVLCDVLNAGNSSSAAKSAATFEDVTTCQAQEAKPDRL